MKLRLYQRQTIDNVRNAWRDGDQDVLVMMATGGGKTVVFLALIDEILQEQPTARILIIAHRKELIEQPAERMAEFYPQRAGQVGIVMADQNQPDRQITIATIQTLQVERRLTELLSHGPIDYLIVDEAHHSSADGYLAVIQALKDTNPQLKHLGVTATPVRSDNNSLPYGREVTHLGIKELVRDGFLAPPRWLAIQTGISLADVPVYGSEDDRDFSQKGLVDVFETDNCFELVAETHTKYAAGRKAIAFVSSVAGGYRLAEIMTVAGIPAVAADGTTKKADRSKILSDFRAGRHDVLVNMGLYTEGLDVPEVSCIHQVRPTKSDGLYCLDIQTEILTRQGWRDYENVSVGDLVAGYDTKTRTISWISAMAKIVRPLGDDEIMFGLNSPSLDIRVTDHHRMIYRNRRSSDSDWRITPASLLSALRDSYIVPVAGYETALGVPLTDDEIRFIGWYITDGSLNERNGQIVISQASHQPYHGEIMAMLEGCGFKYGVSEIEYAKTHGMKNTSPSIRYYVSRGAPRGYDKHLRGWGALEAYIDKNFSPLLDNLTASQLAVLLEAMHLGDGSKQNGQTWTRRSYHIATGNRVMADRLQSLCVRRGWRCNLAEHNYNVSPIYFLHIKHSDERSVGGKTAQSADGRGVFAPVAYTPGEMVWCVENSLGTLITRRFGKIAILGNCQMIGRALRTFPGKVDALILDYAPLDARNITMLGDVLGVDAKKEAYVEETEEIGAVIAGFTFDGSVKWLSGNPMELVSRQLDYLNMSPWRWTKPSGHVGPMVLGLGPGDDGIDRSLVISAPATIMHVWLVAKSPEDRWSKAYSVQTGTFEECSAWAEDYAERRGNLILARKAKKWRGSQPSEGQVKFARNLGIWQSGMTRGDCADAITAKLAIDAVKRATK